MSGEMLLILVMTASHLLVALLTAWIVHCARPMQHNPLRPPWRREPIKVSDPEAPPANGQAKASDPRKVRMMG